MNWCIVNKDGLLYAGVVDGDMTWSKLKRDSCLINERIVDAVLKQLTELGFVGLQKYEADKIARKWVPK